MIGRKSQTLTFGGEGELRVKSKELWTKRLKYFIKDLTTPAGQVFISNKNNKEHE